MLCAANQCDYSRLHVPMYMHAAVQYNAGVVSLSKNGPAVLDVCLPIDRHVRPDGYPHAISMSCNACTAYGLHQGMLLASTNWQ